MTVKELIEQLTNLEPQRKVVICNDDGDEFPIEHVGQSVATLYGPDPKLVAIFVGECK